MKNKKLSKKEPDMATKRIDLIATPTIIGVIVYQLLRREIDKSSSDKTSVPSD